MPVRNVSKRTMNTVRYLVPSAKNNRVVHCESTLERDMALRLEFAPNVVAYEEQPERFRIPFEPKSYSTIPDFKVTLDTGEVEYLEVKYVKAVLKRIARLQTTESHMGTLGSNYKVMTEKQIRTCQQVLHNCIFLKAFKVRRVNKIEELMELLPSSPVTFSEWAAHVGSKNTVVEMIASQLIFVDLYQPITADSVLRPLKEGDYEYMYSDSFDLVRR